MKKILLLLLSILFLGSGCTKNEAKDPVIDYLNLYKNHDIKVMNSLNELMTEENMSEEEKNIYLYVMKRQYQDLEYCIKDQIYNGDKATVIVEITVYDYQNSKKDTHTKMESLQKMNKESKRIKYTINFTTYYEKDKWLLDTPDYTVLQKIHGIYE